MSTEPPEAHCEIFPRCGDGVIQYPEQCDDGNDDNTDGCSNECRIVASCTRTDCSLGGTIQPQMTEGEVPVDRTFDKFGFGSAIARTETFLFVGHRQDGSGSVTVYRNADNGDELSPVQVITPPDHGLSNEPTTGFGASISASERYLIIGAPDGSNGGGWRNHDSWRGAVYVYEYESAAGCFGHLSDASAVRTLVRRFLFMMTIKGHTLLLVRLVIAFLVALSIGVAPGNIFNAGQVLVFEVRRMLMAGLRFQILLSALRARF